MKFFQLINGVMTCDEGAYPYSTEWAPRAEVERNLIQHAEHFYKELEQADQRTTEAIQDAAKWKQLAEFEYGKLRYPENIDLGEGALNEYFKTFTYDAAKKRYWEEYLRAVADGEILR